MRVRTIFIIYILILAVPFTVKGEKKEDQIFRLRIGNPNWKDKQMAISPGQIYSAKNGKSLSFSQLIKELSRNRFIYIGESHNSLPMHRVQAKIIRALYEHDQNLAIGLEMFPVTRQEVLNKWSLGILEEEDFIHEGQWYVNWNFHFGFYRDIFLLAKNLAIPVYALNVPKKVITKIRRKGWMALTDQEKKMVPQPDLSHEEHRYLIRTMLEETHLPPQMKGKGLEMVFEGLYRAQSAWDEAMAFYAVKAAKKKHKTMVVLAGSGHLLYNLGISRRAYDKSQRPFATVICVHMPPDRERVEVSRSLSHYVWGLSAEEKPAFPSVGLSFKTFDGLENLVIDRDPINGVAKGQDFKKGDVVLSVDGKGFSGINELRLYLSQFSWNDEVVFRLLREGKEREIILKFEEQEKDK